MIQLALLLACHHPATPTVSVAGHTVVVEIADDPGERAQGLMYRDALGMDAGMLFVYPAPRQLGFWMENTRIPLSIAYLDPEGNILNIEDMAPLDRTSIPSRGEALYALEVNQGWFDRHGVAVGDQVMGLPGPSQR